MSSLFSTIGAHLNMAENDWWLPSRLKADEASARLLNDFNQLDTKGDFGSYRRLVLGDSLENSNASVHNDLFPRSKVHQIFRFLDLGSPKTILDAGCGLGYTTTVIAELLPDAHVLGIDLAEDAIAYATNHHKNASFGVIALDPSAERIGTFDLIFCFEIYPFSRNRDASYQSQLINNLSNNLAPEGKIIISQTWRNKDALPPVLGQVSEMCPDLSFEVVPYPHPRIPLWLPRKLALYAAKVVEKLTGKEVVKKLIVISKRA
jgi:2-polyprenyl-3-methyl-5-hydroxy-6-metoxy-1,4-benzoquinol methylase